MRIVSTLFAKRGSCWGRRDVLAGLARRIAGIGSCRSCLGQGWEAGVMPRHGFPNLLRIHGAPLSRTCSLTRRVYRWSGLTFRDGRKPLRQDWGVGYSRKVSQRTRTEVVAQAFRRMVTGGMDVDAPAAARWHSDAPQAASQACLMKGASWHRSAVALIPLYRFSGITRSWWSAPVTSALSPRRAGSSRAMCGAHRSIYG
jgi:hypothetical protein